MDKKPVSDSFININNVILPSSEAIRTSSRCSCGSVTYSVPSEPALSAASGDKVVFIEPPPNLSESPPEMTSIVTSGQHPTLDPSSATLPSSAPPEVHDTQSNSGNSSRDMAIIEVQTDSIQSDTTMSLDNQSDSLYPGEVY